MRRVLKYGCCLMNHLLVSHPLSSLSNMKLDPSLQLTSKLIFRSYLYITYISNFLNFLTGICGTAFLFYNNPLLIQSSRTWSNPLVKWNVIWHQKRALYEFYRVNNFDLDDNILIIFRDAYNVSINVDIYFLKQSAIS